MQFPLTHEIYVFLSLDHIHMYTLSWILLLKKPGAHSGNEWNWARYAVGKSARVPDSMYIYIEKCMYVCMNGMIRGALKNQLIL